MLCFNYTNYYILSFFCNCFCYAPVVKKILFIWFSSNDLFIYLFILEWEGKTFNYYYQIFMTIFIWYWFYVNNQQCGALPLVSFIIWSRHTPCLIIDSLLLIVIIIYLPIFIWVPFFLLPNKSHLITNFLQLIVNN